MTGPESTLDRIQRTPTFVIAREVDELTAQLAAQAKTIEGLERAKHQTSEQNMRIRDRLGWTEEKWLGDCILSYQALEATLTAQAAEVERLTGEVENLGQALAYQESLIPAEEVAHLRDRATTAEASLETARGALEGLRKQIADEVRNRDLGEVRGISLGDEATLIGVVNEFRKLTAHEIADFIDGTPPHVITDIDRDLPTVQYDAAWPDDKKAEALAALPSPPITKGPKP